MPYDSFTGHILQLRLPLSLVLIRPLRKVITALAFSGTRGPGLGRAKVLFLLTIIWDNRLDFVFSGHHRLSIFRSFLDDLCLLLGPTGSRALSSRRLDSRVVFCEALRVRLLA